MRCQVLLVLMLSTVHCQKGELSDGNIMNVLCLIRLLSFKHK